MIKTYQERKVVPGVKVVKQGTWGRYCARQWVGVGKRRVGTCGQRICVVSNMVTVTRMDPCVGMPMTGDLDRVGGRWWCCQLVISAHIYGVSKDIKAVSLGTDVFCRYIPFPMCRAYVIINGVGGGGVIKTYQEGKAVPGVRVVEQGARSNRTGSRVIKSFRFSVMETCGGFG